MKIRVYLTGVFLVICVFAEALAFVGNNCDFPDNWQVMETTEDDADKALLDLDTATINIDKPFYFNIAMCSDNGIKANRVTLSWANSVEADTEITTGPFLLNAQELAQAITHGPWPIKTKPDPSNKLSDNQEAIEFGRRLFFSTRLSGDNSKSCISCHSPDESFASGRVIKENPDGLDRNTLGLLNVRYNRWFGWDGGNDNLWAQSIRPIVNRKEMNLPKERLRSVIEDSTFGKPYKQFFGEISDHPDDLVLVNIGKALAAYQETLITQTTPFDRFRDAAAAEDWSEAAKYPVSAQRGLSLFLGKGNCSFCHSGPLFSNGEFHDAGVPYFIKAGVVDKGRHQGIIDLKRSPFTLASNYNDDPRKEGAWAVNKVATLHSNFGIFRVPSLRNVANTAPYMHNGSLSTLKAVVDHYANINIERLHADGEAILKPLNLSQQETEDLVSFLESLSDSTQSKP